VQKKSEPKMDSKLNPRNSMQSFATPSAPGQLHVPPKCLQSEVARNYVASHPKLKRALVIQPRRVCGTANRLRAMRGYLFLAMISQRALYIDWGHELSELSHLGHKMHLQEGSFVTASSFDWTMEAFRGAYARSRPHFYNVEARSSTYAEDTVLMNYTVIVTGVKTNYDLTQTIAAFARSDNAWNSRLEELLANNWSHCGLRLLFNFDTDALRTPVCRELAMIPKNNIGVHVRTGNIGLLLKATKTDTLDTQWHRQQAVSDMESCAIHLKQLSSTPLGMFITGDSPNIVTSFVSRMHKHNLKDIFSRPDHGAAVHSGKGHNKDAALRALVDVIILAISSVTIIGSIHSSYTGLAADLAGMHEELDSNFMFYTGFLVARIKKRANHTLENERSVDACKTFSSDHLKMCVDEGAKRMKDFEPVITCHGVLGV